MEMVIPEGYKVRVLVVDDERSLLQPLKSYLENEFGYLTDTALAAEEALRLVKKNSGRYDVALIDQTLVPGMDGISLMKEIRVIHPETECVIFTGWGEGSKQEALKQGAFRYIEKPFDRVELAILIRSAAQQARLRNISRAILSQHNLEDLLQVIISGACSLVFGEEAAIALLGADKKIHVCRSTLAQNQAQLCGAHFKQRKIAQEIIDTGKIHYVEDLAAEEGVDPIFARQGYRSLVGIPIPDEGRGDWLGVLFVYSKNEKHFGDYGNLTILQTMANQAGLAILNGRAEQDVKKHIRYMQALVDVGRGLTSENELQKQLELAWHFVQGQLGVETFFVGLYDAQNDQVVFPLVFDKGAPTSLEPRFLGGDRKIWGGSGYVIKTGKELLWNNSAERQELSRGTGIVFMVSQGESRSGYFLPLLSESEVLGTISFQAYEDNALSEIQLDAFRALASQLAVAIKNARLLKEEEKRAKEAETLQTAAAALTESLDQKVVIAKILGELQKVVAFDYASVQLLVEKNGEEVLEIVDGRGFPNYRELLGWTFPIHEDKPNRQVVEQRACVIFDDVPEEYPHFNLRPHAQSDIHGWLGVPMIVHDRLIGMVALDSRQKGFYKAEHARLAQAFITQAAVAIDNARRHEETGQANKLLETLTEMTENLRSDRPQKDLFFEVVRLASELGQFREAVLLASYPYLHEFEIDAVYPPRENLVGKRIGDPQAAVSKIIDSGKVDVLTPPFAQFKGLFAAGTRMLVAVPVKYGVESKHVLLLADKVNKPVSHRLREALRKFATQAAISIHTSSLLNTNQYHFTQLSILKKANDFIQAGIRSKEDLYKVLHVLLTGITAGYGLRYNRAVLLKLKNDTLIGEIAIGHLTLDEADKAWEESNREGFNDFTTYLKALEDGNLERTPLEEKIRSFSMNVVSERFKKFTRGLVEKGYLEVSAERLDHVPEFHQFFQPVGPILVLPLVSKDDLIGLLIVDNKFTQVPYNPEEKEALITFANTAAVAIKNYRMLRSLEETQKVTREIAQVMALGDLDKTLVSIRKSAELVLGCDIFTLYAYDPNEGRFVKCEHFGSKHPEGILKPEEIGPTSTVFKILSLEKVYYYSTNPRQDKFLSGKFVERENIKASLGIKLVFQGVSVGVLFINYLRQHEFSLAELENVKLFADQAAIAIQNSTTMASKEKRARSLEILYDAAKKITATLSLQEMLKSIAQSARTLTGIDDHQVAFCNVLLHEKNLLIFFASDPEGFVPPEQALDLRAASPRGIVVRAFNTKKAQLVPDVSKDEDYLEFRKGTRSELAVPLVKGAEVLGVINLEHTSLNAFSAFDQQVIEALAAQASVAIDNARTYEELRKTKGIVEGRTALAWLGMASSTSYHAIANYAATINGQIGLIKGDLGESLDEPQNEGLKEQLSVIERNAQRIQAKSFILPLSSEEGLEIVPLNELIYERVSQLWKNSDFRQTLQLPRLELSEMVLNIRVSREWFKRAFDIIVQNAVEAVKKVENPGITIGTRTNIMDFVEVFITDNGQGIPDEIKNKIGLDRIQKPEDALGLGMGLLMAQTIAQTYGGEIKVEQTGPSGTTMVICIPRYDL
jgi:GAF domain-containing protein/CheY-like chemotaxis protein